MNGYSREFIGTVNIETGHLVVGDGQPKAIDPTLLRHMDTGEFKGKVVVLTPYLNGSCQVFVSRDDHGEIKSVEIVMEE